MHARDLAAAIEGAPLSVRPLREVVAELPSLIDADQACAFLVRPDRKLDFFYGARMPAGIRPAYEKWLLHAPKNFAHYDPARPDPRQRNVALRRGELEEMTGRVSPPGVRSFLPRFGLSESDQLRALICDGPVLLAWIGGLRAKPFGRAGARQLQAIVPSLQRRLALERSLGEAQRTAQEVTGALEEVPAAAFVLAPGGAVLHANAAGRALLDLDRKTVEERVSAALRGSVDGVQLARLAAGSELKLAILQAGSDPTPRVAAARSRWQLTNRQAQVLHLVAQGFSNRHVSLLLGCSESTVELHVTALLHKSECENRAQLVARVWSGG